MYNHVYCILRGRGEGWFLDGLANTKWLFINNVIISAYPRFSLQTTHVLRVYNVLSVHRWSELKVIETRRK